MQKIVAITTLLVILFVINFSIYKKEQLLEEGQIVFLKLAPVDPRSLMQGDFMALRFELANTIQSQLKNKRNFAEHIGSKQSFDGLVYVRLDENNVASFISFDAVNETQETAISPPESANTIPLEFRLRKGQVKFATNAFYFEEGTAKKLEAAKYGKFRVNPDGELLLVTLHDENLVKLG
jgi:uncharacterized membrane-anchored protein